MKKILAIAALFAAIIFTGCSKDDDSGSGNGMTGGSPYSGVLLGTWSFSDRDNNPSETDIYYLYNDGSFTRYEEYDGESAESYGLFYVQDNIIAFLYIKAKFQGTVYDFNDFDGRYVDYFYIFNDTEIKCFESFDGEYIDFDYVNDLIERFGTPGDSYNSLYVKQ